MDKKKIDVIVGARPNFMKAAALFAVADQFSDLTLRLIHTGQHYDHLMSKVFLDEFNLPKPEACLEVGSHAHAVQTAEIMKAYHHRVMSDRPDLCMVVGDVNSTVACALVVSKLGIPVAHIEAGLRSFDRSMPEEINRVLTDSISDIMFTTESSAKINLLNEARPEDKIFFVGHVMIDTLLRTLSKARDLQYYQSYNLQPGRYAYVTLHRPSNVDSPEKLKEISEHLVWLSQKMPIIFPAHPRTKQKLIEYGLKQMLLDSAVILVDPLAYSHSVSLVAHAKVVITDSGGLQEETSAIGIPCLTLRDNTERPITVELGTNTLIAGNWDLFERCIHEIASNNYLKKSQAIPLWDGYAGSRILAHCCEFLSQR